MSRKGSPWENGYQESFYSNFKLELENTNRFENEGQLIEKIYHQMYYYNNQRIQSSIGNAAVKALCYCRQRLIYVEKDV